MSDTGRVGRTRGAMSDRITTDVVEKVALMNKNIEGHPPVSVWNAIKELLISGGIAYTLELSAELLPWHPGKRRDWASMPDRHTSQVQASFELDEISQAREGRCD